MDDRTPNGSTFIDEEIDFDTILEEDDAPQEPSRRMLKSRKRDAYRPKRLGRTAPNWSRIATALFIGAVVLFVIAFGVKSVLDHRKASAYKDYFGQVSEVTTQSDAQGKELSDLLSQPSGADRTQLIARLEKLTGRARTSLADSRAIETPDSMTTTHAWLVTTMQYRVNGLNGLQKAMIAALAAKDQNAAAVAVAAANERLAASDVIMADSFAGNARRVLAREKVTDVTVQESEFVTDPEFTSPKAMALMLGRLTSGRTAATKDGKVIDPKDGKIHGGQLGAVTISPSGETLSATGVTEIAGSDDLAFEVTFDNQGEGQETQVPVTITLKDENSEPQELNGVLETVDPGELASVQIRLEEVPTFGETLTATVQVGPVPGEKDPTNNAATFQLLFKL